MHIRQMKGELIKENPRLRPGLDKILSKENAIPKVMFPFTSIHTSSQPFFQNLFILTGG